LSSTDKVLAGFEQLSQSTTQLDDKLASQPVSNTTTQPDDKLTSQQVSKITTQPDDKLTSQQVSKITTQPDDKLTSQQVNKTVIRKATFQLSEAVLQQLDKFHLQLQLELGKGVTPYKEVIVEEAITRLLEQAQSNPEELISVLRFRQEKRK
jgi:tryptophanyl-tRNA synthetase